jgi:hypothetical protein
VNATCAGPAASGEASTHWASAPVNRQSTPTGEPPSWAATVAGSTPLPLASSVWSWKTG